MQDDEVRNVARAAVVALKGDAMMDAMGGGLGDAADAVGDKLGGLAKGFGFGS